MCQQHIGSISELAKRSGIKRQLLYDRINEPQTFKIFELMALDAVLHFSEEDLLKIVRGA